MPVNFSITLDSAGGSSGPYYVVTYSTGSIFMPVLSGSPAYLPTVGSFATVTVPSEVTGSAYLAFNLNNNFTGDPCSVCDTDVVLIYTSGSPIPTPTPSVTPSISVTPTVTPSISVTPTITPTISITPSITPSTTPPSCYTTWTIRNADCGGGTVNDIGINGTFMGTLEGPSTFPLTSTLYGDKTDPNGVICSGSNTIQANVTTNIAGTGNCGVMFIYINGIGPLYTNYFGNNPFPQISGVQINDGDYVEVEIACISGSCPTPSPSITPSITATPVSPSITPTVSITVTLTPTPTPTPSVPGCVCYTILNETGGALDYTYTPCGGGPDITDTLAGGANVQVCSPDLPIVDPGMTVNACTSTTNCTQNSDCTGCS